MRKCRNHPLLEAVIYVPFAGISEWLVPEIILGATSANTIPPKRNAVNDQICRRLVLLQTWRQIWLLSGICIEVNGQKIRTFILFRDLRLEILCTLVLSSLRLWSDKKRWIFRSRHPKYDESRPFLSQKLQINRGLLHRKEARKWKAARRWSLPPRSSTKPFLLHAIVKDPFRFKFSVSTVLPGPRYSRAADVAAWWNNSRRLGEPTDRWNFTKHQSK